MSPRVPSRSTFRSPRIDYPYQMAALDHCVGQGWIRPDSLAVTGTSYGGFMT